MSLALASRNIIASTNVKQGSKSSKKNKRKLSNKVARQSLEKKLLNMGLQKKYIDRAFIVHERNYGTQYQPSINFMADLVKRLELKDKNKNQNKQVKNKFGSIVYDPLQQEIIQRYSEYKGLIQKLKFYGDYDGAKKYGVPLKKMEGNVNNLMNGNEVNITKYNIAPKLNYNEIIAKAKLKTPQYSNTENKTDLWYCNYCGFSNKIGYNICGNCALQKGCHVNKKSNARSITSNQNDSETITDIFRSESQVISEQQQILYNNKTGSTIGSTATKGWSTNGFKPDNAVQEQHKLYASYQKSVSDNNLSEISSISDNEIHILNEIKDSDPLSRNYTDTYSNNNDNPVKKLNPKMMQYSKSANIYKKNNTNLNNDFMLDKDLILNMRSASDQDVDALLSDIERENNQHESSFSGYVKKIKNGLNANNCDITSLYTIHVQMQEFKKKMDKILDDFNTKMEIKWKYEEENYTKWTVKNTLMWFKFKMEPLDKDKKLNWKRISDIMFKQNINGYAISQMSKSEELSKIGFNNFTLRGQLFGFIKDLKYYKCNLMDQMNQYNYNYNDYV
mmetsp:Transcript_42078/g.51793  ORF Transcript_42078/g.51793 Transcript_42078/m.51793 type:complete len:562 (-) Transcript_42078:39-1724(-)